MTKPILRLRVFAGPNGSGKSTIINAVRNYRVYGRPVDFGIYVNADDIAASLRAGSFSFVNYEITATLEEICSIAVASGLLSSETIQEQFRASFSYENNRITLLDASFDERLAQLLADFLRKKLLSERKKFSFETVFSHESKLDIMRQAAEQGYKVYLYFISTKDYRINQFRVENRVKQGGHDVPKDKIKSRYYRSLGLLYQAAQLTYQTFFFDNSVDKEPGETFEPFLSFKVVQGKKLWSHPKPDPSLTPSWFIEHYSNKILKNKHININKKKSEP